MCGLHVTSACLCLHLAPITLPLTELDGQRDYLSRVAAARTASAAAQQLGEQGLAARLLEAGACALAAYGGTAGQQQTSARLGSQLHACLVASKGKPAH
jgi:hypothetical protein